MFNHYIPARIDFGVGSVAHLSSFTPNTLIVMLHGLGGTAEGTWHDFSSRFKLRDTFDRSDVIFLGYDSFASRASIISRGVFQFLDNLISNPADYTNRYIYYGRSRSPQFRYEKIVIVAHSLGGAISRQIAIDIFCTERPYRNQTELVLFAPAHKGSNALKLMIDVLRPGNASTLVALFRNFLLFKKPVLQDLEIDSDFIKSLESNTNILVSGGNLGCLVCKTVLFGQFEDIVETTDFAADPPFTVVQGQDHTSICKSNGGYEHPVNLVEGCIR